MSQGWSTNASVEEIASRLRNARRVVVLTHAKPDGDAIGSTQALVRTLNLLGAQAGWGSGAKAEAWYCGPCPPWMQDLVGATPHRIILPGAVPTDLEPDVIAVLDTGSWSQVEIMQPWLVTRTDRTVCLDHHVQGDADIATMRFIDTSAAAVCQVAAELCRVLLGKKSIAELPKEVAEACYLGLATDTGWFKHSNVNHRVMETAGLLLDAGVDHSSLHQTIEQRESVSRLKLLGRALASLELADKDRVAMMQLTRKDFAETKAAPGESGGFVDYGQAISGVVVTCLISEANPDEYGKGDSGPLTKLSLRSKPAHPDVNVNVVAKAFGGGGHVRAAGARVQMTMAEARAIVLAEIAKQTGSATTGRES